MNNDLKLHYMHIKGPSIKEVRSQGGWPVRTRRERLFRCGRPHFIV